MRSFNSLSFWLIAVLLSHISTTYALSLGTNLQEGGECVAEICGEVIHSDPTAAQHTAPQLSAPPTTRRQHMTNARRLALGLSLNPPVRRDDNNVAAPHVSATPQVTYEAMIEARQLSDGRSLGYISTLQRVNGMFQYGAEAADAVKVTFSLDVGTRSGTGMSFLTLNSDGPLLGLVQGRDSTSSDMASNNYNYLYFNGVELPGSLPGSTPASIPNTYTSSTGTSRTAESSVWNIDLNTGLLTVQWTNTDGTTRTLETWDQSGYMYAGGSSAAFHQRYPSPIVPFSLHFVPVKFGWE